MAQRPAFVPLVVFLEKVWLVDTPKLVVRNALFASDRYDVREKVALKLCLLGLVMVLPYDSDALLFDHVFNVSLGYALVRRSLTVQMIAKLQLDRKLLRLLLLDRGSQFHHFGFPFSGA